MCVCSEVRRRKEKVRESGRKGVYQQLGGGWTSALVAWGRISQPTNLEHERSILAPRCHPLPPKIHPPNSFGSIPLRGKQQSGKHTIVAVTNL